MELNEKDIYEKYYNKVYKTTFYILKDRELAKDATHDTFIKVFKNLKKLKDHSKLNAWITTISTRTAIDSYNKYKKRMTYELEETNFLVNTEEINSVKEELNHYLATISPEQKQILILKYIDGLTEKEIAKILSIKLGTVKSRIYRAKQRLSHQYKVGGEVDK
ncbi:RNA polymerase sigma factor [Bacillus sp. B1-b2]|uniref:RNA polymerase sigma factor n=1 Tax=Bacillus sp. B1-b2 TaxID=2653201 RepID=UPI001262379B|nr:RNA polymerase sigma factor [Bacillus sp. B1-b2]KAB7663019.1 RNA polymerase sigma factor [Bacillus sp. B1-b2]